jgi:hypothetical protein
MNKEFPVKDLMVGDLVRWGRVGPWWLIIDNKPVLALDCQFDITWCRGDSRLRHRYGSNAFFAVGVGDIFIVRDGEQIFP